MLRRQSTILTTSLNPNLTPNDASAESDDLFSTHRRTGFAGLLVWPPEGGDAKRRGGYS
jgi:hypothetical protein